MLEKAFIIAFGVMFIWACMLPGMIFGGIRDRLSTLNNGLQKIMFRCPICMTPYYGSILYAILYHQSWQDWLITVFVAAGVVVVFIKLFPYAD